MKNLLDNYNAVLKNIRKIKNNSPIFPEHFQLIAVSKTFGEDVISKLLEEGHRIFGENKIQTENKWTNLKKILVMLIYILLDHFNLIKQKKLSKYSIVFIPLTGKN